MIKRILQLKLIVLAVFFITSAVLSQSVNKIAPPTEILYSNSSCTNEISSYSKEPQQQKTFSAEKQELLNLLDQARLSGDIAKKELLEKQLNALDGVSTVTLKESQIVSGGKVPVGEQIKGIDYNSTMLNGDGIWASATQTAPSNFPNAGTIYVATGIYASSAGDTCKIYSSTDGGVTFNYLYRFFFNINSDINRGELDIELMYDNSKIWLYGVVGYYDVVNTVSKSVLFRFDLSTGTYVGYDLHWPGYTTNSNQYINPRITSDNSVYASTSYVYFTTSFDSTGNGGSHIYRQKYAHITNPFSSSPTINYTMPSTNGGFFWNTGPTSSGYYPWTDIAFFRTSSSTSRILTVYSINNDNHLYLAWTDDFGNTLTDYNTIMESNVNRGARMVFNGGLSNYNGMIAFVRKYTATDWDPYCYTTTNGGTNWTSGYIDGSSNYARSIDIVAPRGANNVFKIAYIQDSASTNYVFYAGGNLSGFNNPYRKICSPSGVDTSFGKAVAGYKLTGSDDSFLLYSYFAGMGLYASRLCASTIGISNNGSEIPKEYSLSQNYPNPFNPSTTIKFSLPKLSNVKLIVYDVLGNEITTLENGKLNPGNYIVDFNTSSLSSGVYFYKLTADNYTETKRMILIK